LFYWWHWISNLFQLAWRNERYTHVLLVVPVSLALALLEGRAKGVRREPSPLVALAMVVAALAVRVAGTSMSAVPDLSRALAIASLVLCWLGLFSLFYGMRAFRQLSFPLLFLFLITPLPTVLLEKCIAGLQLASTACTEAFFRLAQVPVVRNGFVLSVPALDIEIGKECSGIRSSWMLFLCSLVLAHLYLPTLWTKIPFVLASIPLAIVKNAVRIFTLSMLGMHVDPSFLYGDLHRNGGILFFVLALAGLAVILLGLRRVEQSVRNYELIPSRPFPSKT